MKYVFFLFVLGDETSSQRGWLGGAEDDYGLLVFTCATRPNLRRGLKITEKKVSNKKQVPWGEAAVVRLSSLEFQMNCVRIGFKTIVSNTLQARKSEVIREF